MELVFLGTSSAVPTRQRGLPAIAIRTGRQVILFDCGEGTQRQILSAGLSIQRVRHIFISHLHGDHIFGLPGLLQSMALNRRVKPLTVYCPEGEAKLLYQLLAGGHGLMTFEVNIRELEEGAIVDLGNGMRAIAGTAEHTVTALAFRLEERPKPGKFNETAALKLGLPRGPLWGRLQDYEPVEHEGRTIEPEQVMGPRRPARVMVYSGDSRPCPGLGELAKGATILVHDATFATDKSENAVVSGHSTAAEAALLAKEASVGQLYLTHFSQRYKDTGDLLKEARAIFPATEAAFDLLKVQIIAPRA